MDSKNKGTAFERTIAKDLSLWWSSGEREDLFWRTASSGGRATQREKEGKPTAGQDGDICATSPSSHPLMEKIIIECKRYKSLNLWNIATGGPCLFRQWYSNLSTIAYSQDKCPVIIMKEDNHPIMIALPSHLLDALVCEMDLTLSMRLDTTMIEPVSIILFNDFIEGQPSMYPLDYCIPSN